MAAPPANSDQYQRSSTTYGPANPQPYSQMHQQNSYDYLSTALASVSLSGPPASSSDVASPPSQGPYSSTQHPCHYPQPVQKPADHHPSTSSLHQSPMYSTSIAPMSTSTYPPTHYTTNLPTPPLYPPPSASPCPQPSPTPSYPTVQAPPQNWTAPPTPSDPAGYSPVNYTQNNNHTFYQNNPGQTAATPVSAGAPPVHQEQFQHPPYSPQEAQLTPNVYTTTNIPPQVAPYSAPPTAGSHTSPIQNFGPPGHKGATSYEGASSGYRSADQTSNQAYPSPPAPYAAPPQLQQPPYYQNHYNGQAQYNQSQPPAQPASHPYTQGYNPVQHQSPYTHPPPPATNQSASYFPPPPSSQNSQTGAGSALHGVGQPENDIQDRGLGTSVKKYWKKSSSAKKIAMGLGGALVAGIVGFEAVEALGDLTDGIGGGDSTSGSSNGIFDSANFGGDSGGGSGGYGGGGYDDSYNADLAAANAASYAAAVSALSVNAAMLNQDAGIF